MKRTAFGSDEPCPWRHPDEAPMNRRVVVLIRGEAWCGQWTGLRWEIERERVDVGPVELWRPLPPGAPRE